MTTRAGLKKLPHLIGLSETLEASRLAAWFTAFSENPELNSRRKIRGMLMQDRASWPQELCSTPQDFWL